MKRELNELGEKIQFELYYLLKEEYGDKINIGRKKILISVPFSNGNEYEEIAKDVMEKINKVKIKLMEKMNFDNALDKLDWFYPIKNGCKIHYKVDFITSYATETAYFVKLGIYMYGGRVINV